MNDFINIQDVYSRYITAITRANELNKNALFDALQSTGITAITVEFDGVGDSGQLADPCALAGGDIVELPDTDITCHRARYGDDGLHIQDCALTEAIESLCYSYLEQEHGGWENNDGAFGEFTFDIAAKTISLVFNGRYCDYSTSEHSF